MYASVFRQFLLFLVMSFFSHAVGIVEEPSEEEEIRDTIVVHGMVLYGQVVSLGPEKLSFRLLYSEGLNHIAYKDIESISTKYNYHISFKRMDIEGRVVGIDEDNKYLKVLEGDVERTIKIADIDNFVISTTDDNSMENKIRNLFPYIRGDANVGFELENGSTKKNKVDLLFNLRHKQAEHELALYLTYAYETTQTEEIDEKVLNKDELVSILNYKNHFKNNQFYFVSLAGDYDKPRHIESRYIPAVGYGYRFRFAKSKWLEPALGVGYVTTDYSDLYGDKDFSAAAIMLSGKYQFDDLAFINTLMIDGFMMYYPGFEKYDEDWVFRSTLNFTVPLFDFFSVKLSVNNTNDSNPNHEVGNNKTTTKLFFGFDF